MSGSRFEHLLITFFTDDLLPIILSLRYLPETYLDLCCISLIQRSFKIVTMQTKRNGTYKILLWKVVRISGHFFWLFSSCEQKAFVLRFL